MSSDIGVSAVRGGASEAIEVPAHPLSDTSLGLYRWQREAFERWCGTRNQGVVEAITGTGKTRLGLAAASHAVVNGRKVLILVPTRELMHQWYREVRRVLPWARVGRVGDNYREDSPFYDIVISTVHSASRDTNRFEGEIIASGQPALLIADETHRYGAETFSKALTERAEWRLGLTATYARDDDAHKTRLDPYFGGTIFRMWYDRALKEKLIAPFDIALVGVDLTRHERAKYDQTSQDITDTHKALMRYIASGIQPKNFFAIVQKWAKEQRPSARKNTAIRYLGKISARKKILAEAKRKYEALHELKPAISTAKRTLLFSTTQDSAIDASRIVTSFGFKSAAMYSDMERDDRSEIMQEFREGDTAVLSAPLILDEGVDVPEADLAIVLAGSRSKRQFVQRLGRVIRKKKDERGARFVVLYARETIEDPSKYNKQNGLAEITEYARNFRDFDLELERRELVEFLKVRPGYGKWATAKAVARRDEPEKIILDPPEPGPPAQVAIVNNVRTTTPKAREVSSSGSPATVRPHSRRATYLAKKSEFEKFVAHAPRLTDARALEILELRRDLDARLKLTEKFGEYIRDADIEESSLRSQLEALGQELIDGAQHIIAQYAGRNSRDAVEYMELIGVGNSALKKALRGLDHDVEQQPVEIIRRKVRTAILLRNEQNRSQIPSLKSYSRGQTPRPRSR